MQEIKILTQMVGVSQPCEMTENQNPTSASKMPDDILKWGWERKLPGKKTEQ